MTINETLPTPDLLLDRESRIRYQEVQEFLYQLELSKGVGAFLYEELPTTFDSEIGDDTRNLNRVYLKLITLGIEYGFNSFGLKGFQNMGEVKIGDRICVVSRRYFPRDFELSRSSYIVILNKRYNLIQYQEMDFRAGYLLQLRETDEQEFQRLFTYTLCQRIQSIQEFDVT